MQRIRFDVNGREIDGNIKESYCNHYPYYFAFSIFRFKSTHGHETAAG
ncbi:hypothetical protein MED222_05650 [Vibrio sp. MED222]|nr:hypothetical protein MED222_05650 [Vibrio sp. MED222]